MPYAYAASMATMKPGECRWIGRPDLHVYCWGSTIDGCYRPELRRFKLVTAARPDAWTADGWTTADAVAREIDATLAQEIAA